MNTLSKKKIVIAITIIVVSLCIFMGNLISFPNFIKTSLYPVAKRIERNRIIASVNYYKTRETKNFIIRYKSQDKEISKLTAEIAERYYKDVCDLYEYYPEEKSLIIIYDSGKELLKNVGLDSESAPLGVYYSGTINILSPRLWIDNENDFENIYEVKGPIVHEFTHLIVDQMTNGNYPLWLTEGLALYTEYITTGFEWKLNSDLDISIDMLNKDFYSIDQKKSYRKSFEIVKSISEEWGFDKVVKILDNLGKGDTVNRSVRNILKVNLKDID